MNLVLEAIEIARNEAYTAAYHKEFVACVAAGMDQEEALEWALSAGMDAADAYDRRCKAAPKSTAIAAVARAYGYSVIEN
jgi:electron transfer flavoprotein alpha/beta subunit